MEKVNTGKINPKTEMKMEYGIQTKGELWFREQAIWFTTHTYSSKKSAEKIMNRLKDANPKESYRLVCREVTEWKEVK